MGYFDGIVDGSFKTTDDGVLLYYPFGVLGKGYVIPTNEKKQEIRKRLKWLFAVSLILIIASASSLAPSVLILSIPWWIVGIAYLLLIIGLSLVSYFIAKGFTKGLTPVGKKLTVAESYQNSAKSHKIFTLIVLEIASLLFVVAGIWMMFNNHVEWYFRLNGVLSILFFGFGSVAIGYMIKVKIQK